VKIGNKKAISAAIPKTRLTSAEIWPEVVRIVGGYDRLGSLILLPNLGKRFEHRPAPGANAWNIVQEGIFTSLVEKYSPMSHLRKNPSSLY